MATKDVDDDTKYLSALMVNRHTFWSQIQGDLQSIQEAFHQQVSFASLTQLQWSHMSSDETFVLGSPASKIVSITKLLRSLILTRERISRMATRFVYTNRFYKEVADINEENIMVSVKEWDSQAESIILLLEKNKKRFDAVIKEMEDELAQAEKDFSFGPCATNAEHIKTLFRRAFHNLTASDKDDADKRFAELQDQIKAQSVELSRLKQLLEGKDESCSKKDDVEMSDEAYWTNTIQEVSGTVPEAEQPERPGPPELVSDVSDLDGEWEIRSAAWSNDSHQQGEEPMEEANSSTSSRDKPPQVSEEMMESHPTLEWDRVVEHVVRDLAGNQGRQDRVVERVDRDRVVERVRRDQGKKRSPKRVVELMPGPSNQEEFGSMEPGEASHRQGEDAIRQRIEFLQSLVDRMENDIRNFPHRKREYLSPYMGRLVRCMFCKVVGEHYSDSCPAVTDGDERFNIVLDENECQYCLEGCNPDKECPYKKKGCFYCKRVKGTAFEWLIPADKGHHKALCNIPNKRHVARARLNEARDELRELFRELYRITTVGRNDTNRLEEQPAQNGREKN